MAAKTRILETPQYGRPVIYAYHGYHLFLPQSTPTQIQSNRIYMDIIWPIHWMLDERGSSFTLASRFCKLSTNLCKLLVRLHKLSSALVTLTRHKFSNKELFTLTLSWFLWCIHEVFLRQAFSQSIYLYLLVHSVKLLHTDQSTTIYFLVSWPCKSVCFLPATIASDHVMLSGRCAELSHLGHALTGFCRLCLRQTSNCFTLTGEDGRRLAAGFSLRRVQIMRTSGYRERSGRRRNPVRSYQCCSLGDRFGLLLRIAQILTWYPQRSPLDRCRIWRQMT